MPHGVPCLSPRAASRSLAGFAAAALLALLASCTPATGVAGLAPTTMATAQATPARVADPAAIEEGFASWYGPGFAGRLTASGEIFDPNELTAAHQTLPFGTRLRVTNTRSGRSVVVRINDRGPFVGDRVIDLSRAAAEAIGMIGSGVAHVSLVPVTGETGAVRAGMNPVLNPFEVISAGWPVGTLLVLSGIERSDRVLVRVVANGPEANGDVTMQVSRELFATIGPAVIVETE